MLYSSDICLKCSPPTDHASQAGSNNLQLEGFVGNVRWNWVLFYRVLLSVSLLEGRQGNVTCKRLGWDTLCCLCVSAIATDTVLQCFLDFEWVLFVLSVLGVGWRIVFLMSQMSNVNGIERHTQLSR